jgi:hypothetical protein
LPLEGRISGDAGDGEIDVRPLGLDAGQGEIFQALDRNGDVALPGSIGLLDKIEVDRELGARDINGPFPVTSKVLGRGGRDLAYHHHQVADDHDDRCAEAISHGALLSRIDGRSG